RLAELTGTTDAVDSTPKTQVDSTPAVVDAVKSTPPEVSKVSTDERSIDAANVAFRKGDLATALSIYREFIENKTSDEEYSFALLQIGNIYRERRDFRSAVAKYREIVESYPNSDWANEAERAWEDAVWQENNASILPRQNKR
ncbi:MAG TPA: tetratricopeptide repeat protein, partial [Fibrobacteraceae bacterium]|nr:tetratricopeptide repeat protein [Fibrobacteraceae bacterium]